MSCTMKLTIISALMMIIMTAGLTAELSKVPIQYPFLEEYHYPNILVVCFEMDAVQRRDGVIRYTHDENGIVQTKIESFNQLAEKLQIVDMEQKFYFWRHLDWHDENGAYLQNVYVVHFKDNGLLEQANALLNKDPSIVYAEYEAKQFLLYTPNDPRFHQQWKHPVIQTPLAWDYMKGSSEVIVAITDTGCKWNHPDLADNIWINEAELPGITIDWENGQIRGGDGQDNDGNGKIDDVIGWDFFDRNNNPYQNHPGNSHGTHVAGIAGAVGDNEIGIAGVSMNVSLMTCKGSATNHQSQGIRHGYQQITYAAQTGADVINCSWISYTNQGSQPNQVINAATHLGALVVAGAGNDNVEHTPTNQAYPSDATNALSVAATGPNDTKANFSDFGNPIGIAAPGVNILSTWRADGYNSTSGTSMASPVVAGVAALVKAMHRDLTPNQLMTRLKETADCIDELNPSYVGLLGSGRVNAFRALMHDRMPFLSIFEYEIAEYDGDGDGVPNPGEEINITVSIYNEVGWLRAEDVVVSLSTDAPGVTLTEDVVDFPNISSGSMGFNVNQPFRFKTDPELADLNIPFTMKVTANQDSDYPYVEKFDLDVELSLQKAGWPLSLQGSSSSPALIADIDGNGFNEIIFGDSGGTVHVIKPDKTYAQGFPVELGNTINAGLAIADLTNDGHFEIVANTLAGIINFIDSEGNVFFDYNLEGQLRNNPLIIDAEGKGEYQVVAATFSNPHLYVFNSDGSHYGDFPIPLDGGVMSPPAAEDINFDGQKEIVFVTSAGKLHAISTKTGADINGFPVSLGAASWAGPTVGDATGDGKPDIAVATIQGNVFVIGQTGNQILNINSGGPIRSDVLIIDLTNDGKNELVFGDMSGYVHLLDYEGDYLEPFPVNTGNAFESSPIIADMTNDGNFEIIFGDTSGNVHSINIEGKNTSNFPIKHRSSFSITPAIGYVGQMHAPDILLPNQDGYQFIDFKRPIGEIKWAYHKGNARRTGSNFRITTSVDPDDYRPGLMTELTGNYPNPFNPNTNISFAVGDQDGAAHVVLTVHNIRGRVINTLVDEIKQPGSYTIQWDGTDSKGSPVSSGVYFYSLKTEGQVETKKMMLLK